MKSRYKEDILRVKKLKKVERANSKAQNYKLFNLILALAKYRHRVIHGLVKNHWSKKSMMIIDALHQQTDLFVKAM
jgi:hypothetical protein